MPVHVEALEHAPRAEGQLRPLHPEPAARRPERVQDLGQPRLHQLPAQHHRHAGHLVELLEHLRLPARPGRRRAPAGRERRARPEPPVQRRPVRDAGPVPRRPARPERRRRLPHRRSPAIEPILGITPRVCHPAPRGRPHLRVDRMDDQVDDHRPGRGGTLVRGDAQGASDRDRFRDRCGRRLDAATAQCQGSCRAGFRSVGNCGGADLGSGAAETGYADSAPVCSSKRCDRWPSPAVSAPSKVRGSERCGAQECLPRVRRDSCGLGKDLPTLRLPPALGSAAFSADERPHPAVRAAIVQIALSLREGCAAKSG